MSQPDHIRGKYLNRLKKWDKNYAVKNKIPKNRNIGARRFTNKVKTSRKWFEKQN